MPHPHSEGREKNRVISLWDMIEFVLNQFASDWELFIKTLAHYDCCGNVEPGSFTKTQDLSNLCAAIGRMEFQCQKLELRLASDRASRLLSDIDGGRGVTYSVVLHDLRHLYDLARAELSERVLLFIPPHRNHYFGAEELFGDAVNKAFPSAVPEIQSASNCIAVDLKTAAVFHLMRATEIGLYALAGHLHVTTIGNKKRHIDFSCWGEIIKHISDNMESLVSAPTEQEKRDNITFYKGLLMRCEGIKEHWRNPISHSRKIIDEAELAVVRGHVEQFMRHLSTRVQEK